eukprot:748903-Hanusia_phi.AAC.2
MAMIELIWEPEKQIETVYVFAPKFHERCFLVAISRSSPEHFSGMQPDHIKNIGKAFENAVRTALAEDCRWGEHMSDSFRWLWRLVAEDFFEQLFHLTIRHIRYGVRSEYISPFGQAMILTLEEVLTCLSRAPVVSCSFLFSSLCSCSPASPSLVLLSLTFLQALGDSWCPKSETLWKEVRKQQDPMGSRERSGREEG